MVSFCCHCSLETSIPCMLLVLSLQFTFFSSCFRDIFGEMEDFHLTQWLSRSGEYMFFLGWAWTSLTSSRTFLLIKARCEAKPVSTRGSGCQIACSSLILKDKVYITELWVDLSLIYVYIYTSGKLAPSPSRTQRHTFPEHLGPGCCSHSKFIMLSQT